MPRNDDMHYKASFDSDASPRFGSTMFKIGAALVSGAGLGLLATSLPTVHNANSAEFTSLVGGPMTSIQKQATLAKLPGGAWKNAALAAMEASYGCGRDVSVAATPKVRAAIANMDDKSKAQLKQLNLMVQAKSRASADDDGNEYGLPGVLPPLNWFDPAGFTTDIDKGKLLYYREAEIKHGRICMSGSLGFLVAERYHPLFGGDLDVPSVFAGRDVRLNTFWVALFLLALGVEAQGLKRGANWGWPRDREFFEDAEPGDIGYDPLGLLPEDPEELEEIQNKEILNGRFAMISLSGMIAEELVTGEKLHFTEGLR